MENSNIKESLNDRLNETAVKIYIGDVLTVVSHEGSISNTITVVYTNDIDDTVHEIINLSNRIESWEFLKNVNEKTFGKVLYKRELWGGESTTMPYAESKPDKHRVSS